VYFTQSFTNLVRKFDPAAGTTLTVAGGGYVDHFLAHLGKLSNPLSVAVDSFGNVYVADTQNQRIRRVSGFGGGIGTIAGTGERGYGGDGGPATQAMLASPNSVAVDSAGNLYIADGWNRRIRKVDAATGTIRTIAGTGEQGYGGDGGPATEAGLYSPGGVAVDGSGNVYIADSANHRIRKIDAATATISTIAGIGEGGYSGDGGLATGARLSFPGGVATGSDCRVFIADSENHRIRVLKPNLALESGGCTSAPAAGR
jgi:sugar lactone lactonase YvrE